jgi:hypothetical protein
MDPFDADMFPDTVTVVAPDVGSGVRGDPDPSYNGTPTYSGAAYAELQTDKATRQEKHNLPEGAQLWAVFNPLMDPGAVVDSRLTVTITLPSGATQTSVLWAVANSKAQGGGVFRTWCKEVR